MIKKIVKVIGVLLLLAVAGIAVKFYVLSPKKRAAAELKAPTTAEAVARGKYLAHHVFVCVGCHSKVDESKTGEPLVDGHLGEGRVFPDFPGFPGKIRAPNVTPDKETGLGEWSDGEIVRALREGVSRDGRPLFPMMPYKVYAEIMSDDDALAVVAYLRSLPPIKNKPPQMEINFPISMFVRAAPRPLDKSPAPAPDGKDPLARGRWLLKAGSCEDCHNTANERREPIPGKRMAGGNAFPLPGLGTVYTANITSDKATGIGAYSDEDLMKILSEGKNKAGRSLYGMPWFYYSGMTDEDKKALILALREVPAVANLVPPAELKQ